ncbi:putative disease resistance protein RGA3 [Quercus suber]|uniref:putative disease resistance protein RGA3 n=1 Tax=Quercus suber TaxID=58331 RepID=UPI0032DF20DC
MAPIIIGEEMNHEKSSNLALREIVLIWGVKDKIKKLGETVSTISAILVDAEAKQHNNKVKLWLKRLKDVMFDADDLLDDMSTEALRREVMTQDKKAKEVKAIRERLVAIAADKQFHLEERCEETQLRYKAREQTHSLVCAEDVIVREDDKKEIIGFLLNPSVKDNVSILPIVGIGGLGKTTVAQLVFNDEVIQKHFEEQLRELPRDKNDLVNLRYLEIDECDNLTHMPRRLGKLTNLQRLSLYVMSKDIFDSVLRNNGGLKELHGLYELRGKLLIENLRHGKDVVLESNATNLKEKKHLDSMKLCCIEEDINEEEVGYDEMSLEALEPHPNLKALCLKHYGGLEAIGADKKDEENKHDDFRELGINLHFFFLFFFTCFLFICPSFQIKLLVFRGNGRTFA